MSTTPSATTRHVAPIANSTAEWTEQLKAMSQRAAPSFFHVRAQLPVEGRTNQVLAASRHLNVVLKTYASGGENELHAHTNEDHLFVVMQGGATFRGPNGEVRQVVRNDCVLLPAGSFYCFTANEGEPLVLLRIGAGVNPDADLLARIGHDGKPLDGYSEGNKESGYVLGDRWFE